MAAVSAGELREARRRDELQKALFHHLAFPPHLPQQQDQNPAALELLLLEHLQAASAVMMNALQSSSSSAYRAWEKIRNALLTAKATNFGGRLDREQVCSQLRELKTTQDLLILHIASQNAAILVHRLHDEGSASVMFEMFETSAKRDNVMAAKGALVWDFPGIAIKLPLASLFEDAFLERLAIFLEQASIEVTKNYEYITKAGTQVSENRDTRDPSIITSLLAAILEANGTRVSPKLLRKRVKDDVLWSNTDLPFRRLPYWLTLRVSLARYLAMSLGDYAGRIQYKLFICTVLDILLGRSKSVLTLENQLFIKNKLCRRVFKLHRDLVEVPRPLQHDSDRLFKVLAARFRGSTGELSSRIDREWKEEKHQHMRKVIPQLPRQARGVDQTLRLLASRGYLAAVKDRFSRLYRTRQGPSSPEAPRSKVHVQTFLDGHLHAFELGEKTRHAINVTTGGVADADANCTILRNAIMRYIDRVGRRYEADAEAGSKMLLLVMETWRELDENACIRFPQLAYFRPLFHPRILEVLHLPRLEDMQRARKVGKWLQDRVDRCSIQMTVFDDPGKGCFAAKYFDESEDAEDLRSLRFDIQEAADEQRMMKEQEWNQKTAEYNRLSREIETGTCVYIQSTGMASGLTHDQRWCPKCQLTQQRKRLRIRGFEDPLPSDDTLSKAVVFELACPQAFSSYRDATWAIAINLGRELQDVATEPRVLLRDYFRTDPLLSHFHSSEGSLSLASTSKSFLMTHYATQSFPVDLSQVCRPNALRLSYHDSFTQSWPGRARMKPSFTHHCRVELPTSSPFASLVSMPNLSVDGNGPTSYEIVASQLSCPPGLNTHEFMAFQYLLSGKSRRWMTLLIELASSNLNFSTESAVILVNHLTSQLGPSEGRHEILGAVHSALTDPAFCQALLAQLKRKLESVASNWRESHLMNVIITVCWRLFDITEAQVGMEEQADAAESLLDNAREITLRWMRKLQTEARQASNPNAARNIQLYLLNAALLCKRACFVRIMSAEQTTLSTFVEACIAVHDNIPEKVEELPILIRNAIVRDIRMMADVKDLLPEILLCNQAQDFLAALHLVWPASQSKVAEVNDVQAFPWMRLELHTPDDTGIQTVDYHYMHGLLLVDGQPMGRLPTDNRSFAILTELFGNQSLMQFPSDMPGMSYALTVVMHGWQTHVGYDGGAMVIRRLKGTVVQELIPRGIFEDSSIGFDLPYSLLENCFHWLNIKTNKLEIRPYTNMWSRQNTGWVLDLKTSTCTCHSPTRFGEVLIDPYSDLFGRVNRILGQFEARAHLTVYKPRQHPISVDLKRMGLRFYVNLGGNLQSMSSRAEIDPNQDAGTWYGFESKLVLRDPQDWTERTILVPLGELEVKPAGCHVRVRVKPSSNSIVNYITYTINDTLGRLDCAAEPVVIYKKAQIHAVTSSALQPDLLTGRTGTEEALDLLASAISQPWTPLHSGAASVLLSIARLTPRREWYPSDKRSMKTECWDSQHLISNQHDAFLPLVENILLKSKRLTEFTPNTPEAQTLPQSDDTHLRMRSLIRRQLHQRLVDAVTPSKDGLDTIYEARDRPTPSSTRYTNVFEITDLIRHKPSKMSTVQNLALAVSQSLSVQGYTTPFSHSTLSDRLEVDVCKEWGPLVSQVRKTNCPYELMFLMAPIAFHCKAPMALLRTIVGFFLYDELRTLELPLALEYVRLHPGQTPEVEKLVASFEPFQAPEPADLVMGASASSNEKRKLFLSRQAHHRTVDRDGQMLAKHMVDQWPCPEPTLDGFAGTFLIDLSPARDAIMPEWRRLFDNHTFFQHLETIQKLLAPRFTDLEKPKPCCVGADETFAIPMPTYQVPCLTRDLMRMPNETPMIACPRSVPSTRPRGPIQKAQGTFAEQDLSSTSDRGVADELERLMDQVADDRSTISQKYVDDLRGSITALRQRESQKEGKIRMIELESLPRMPSVQAAISKQVSVIEEAISQPSHTTSAEQIWWLKEGRLWPVVTRVTMLEQLRSTLAVEFGTGMKDSLVNMGLLITTFQRKRRVEKYRRTGQWSRLEEERQNIGHTNWSPKKHTDWLLLEIESSILIRETQVDVARSIASPQSGRNSVLQMNMGQGKSSVVVPMVVALLADTKNLVRIVVPKALLQQTAQLLHTTVGRLLGRQVRHVPFSRRTSTKENTVKLYKWLHRDIQKRSGIMLCVPEHNLSFMLSGQQCLLDMKIPEASVMVRTQAWLNEVSRDILDESDHILAVRTQLIYPSGSLCAVDGHPTRWRVAEAVLAMVDHHLYDLAQTFRDSVQVVRRQDGGFPLLICLLRTDVEDELLNRLRHDICQGVSGLIPMESLEVADRVAVRDFLSARSVRQSTSERINKLCPDQIHIRQTVFLLRGLLCHRILMMTLKKRWNVQYGLHPTRDPIAVPFHAKGVPSDQSEFGHSDVAILLTCLSFYHGGLSGKQIREALEQILKSDDPASLYENWLDDRLPQYLRDWQSINVDDPQQLRLIWECVRYRVAVIDYYLNTFVFPKHARQFRVKIQSNGWDLPLVARSDAAQRQGSPKVPKARTTGFSGTNDNKTLLPLNINQDDLKPLSHTNAEVLTYLLEPRSRRYHTITDHDGKRLDETGFLHLLMRKNIHILIDAGATILEMDNKTLAMTWLGIDDQAVAALYFEGDKPFILSKQGSSMPLLASAYADNLYGVLVYLDEAHTRGTDLHFTPLARGALTLGIGQTKDHTVQAAMRLRQLGTTQSIEFFAPPEVDRSIRQLVGAKDSQSIASPEVLRWLIKNTCDNIEALQPLYYSQGTDYCRRKQAELEFSRYLDDEDERCQYVDTIKQNERQTLQKLYGPQAKPKQAKTLAKDESILSSYTRKLEAKRKAFQDTGAAVHASALQEVEQEREIEFEVESVRQLKRPLPYPAHKFPGIHNDLETFARTGRRPGGSDWFVPMFQALSRTGVGRKYKVDYNAQGFPLFVSREFEKTVKLITESSYDQFLRPVQWVLYSPSPELAVVVIPEEAEYLIPLLRDKAENGKKPATYLLTYAAPITRRMMAFDNLQFYTIPQLPDDWNPPKQLVAELGLFAGRLYFEWAEYPQVCKLLGIDESMSSKDELDFSGSDSTDHDAGSTTDSSASDAVPAPILDGPAEARASTATQPAAAAAAAARRDGGFTPKPFSFTQEWLSVRRRGQDFQHSPMGFLCQAKPLHAALPFFRANEQQGSDAAEAADALAPVVAMAQEADGSDDGSDDDDDDDAAAAAVGGDGGGEMDAGDYDPQAKMREDEEEEDIEYDEADKFQRASPKADDEDEAVPPSRRRQGHPRRG